MAVRLPLFQFSLRHSKGPFSFFQKIILLIALQWALYSPYPLPAIAFCVLACILAFVFLPGSGKHVLNTGIAFSPILGISAVLLFASKQVSTAQAILYLSRLVTSLACGCVFFVSTTHYDYIAATRFLARFPLLRGFSFVVSFIFVFLLHTGESYSVVRDALLLKGIKPFRNPIRYTRYISLGLISNQLHYVTVVHDALVLKQFDMDKWKLQKLHVQRRNPVLALLLACALIAYPVVWEFISH